jgi:hypothetical protein
MSTVLQPASKARGSKTSHRRREWRVGMPKRKKEVRGLR